MTKLFTSLFIILYFSSYSQISLLKDINPGSGNSDAHELTNINGKLFFAAYNPATGFELYKSNNTTAGTTIVKDIAAGTESSSPGELVNLGGKVIFAAANSSYGRELWISDGTSAGTAILKDIIRGVESSNPFHLTKIGTIVYFFVRVEEGVNLWKTDGTPSGTVLITKVPLPEVIDVVELNGLLYFAGYGEIWKSNGTASGTVVTDYLPGYIYNLTSYKGKLIFGVLVQDDASGQFTSKLWASNGAINGAAAIKNVEIFLPEFTPMGGYLYFVGGTDKGRELWRTNGTAAGTTLVKEINTTGNSFTDYYKNGLVASGNYIYFAAINNSGERKLYKSNGTAAGTVKITSSPVFSQEENIYVESTATMVYFTQGNSVWKSDGTETGTTLIKTFTQPVTTLGRVYGALYIAGSTSNTGNELWKYLPPSSASAVASSAKISSDKINVYPNTFKTSAHVTVQDLELGQPLTVKVVSFGGKILSSSTVSNSHENEVGEGLEPGMYILKVEAGKNSYSKVIIKE